MHHYPPSMHKKKTRIAEQKQQHTMNFEIVRKKKKRVCKRSKNTLCMYLFCHLFKETEIKIQTLKKNI